VESSRRACAAVAGAGSHAIGQQDGQAHNAGLLTEHRQDPRDDTCPHHISKSSGLAARDAHQRANSSRLGLARPPGKQPDVAPRRRSASAHRYRGFSSRRTRRGGGSRSSTVGEGLTQCSFGKGDQFGSFHLLPHHTDNSVRRNAGLLLVVVISPVIRRPFTLQYAREQVAPEVWNSPEFSRSNYVISGVWALAFAARVAADLIILYLPAVPVRVGVIITIIALVGAYKFTVWNPERKRAPQPHPHSIPP
jgi:hypothetical protein